MNKKSIIILRVSPEMKKSIEAEADSLGLSTSAFLLLLCSLYKKGAKFEKGLSINGGKDGNRD